MKTYDAIVVGAGPAGASVALRLSRSGRSCLLVDGARFPRDKVCGEGIMPAGVEVLKELGLFEELAQVGQLFHGVRYGLPDGTRAEAHFPDGLCGLAITRRELDTRLVDAVRREGRVDLRLGTWIREVDLPAPGSGQPARIWLGDELLQAPVVIGADGGRSFLRRTAGLEGRPPRRARFGIGAHLVHAPVQDPWPVVEVLLGPACEIYLTPVAPNVTSVAMLVDAARIPELQGRLEAGLRKALAESGAEHLAQARCQGRISALGPLALQARAAHAEGLLLVGDAAGALDPITGEGIALALATGQVLCEVLEGALQRGNFSVGQLATWTRRRRDAVRSLAGLTSLLLYVAERPRHASRVVRSLARQPKTLERLLAVASGSAGLSSLSLRDGMRVLLGV